MNLIIEHAEKKTKETEFCNKLIFVELHLREYVALAEFQSFREIAKTRPHRDSYTKVEYLLFSFCRIPYPRRVIFPPKCKKILPLTYV
jgi:hypothetical protein